MRTVADEAVDCLFVYGTLMRRCRHPMALRLAEQSSLLGAATVSGRLYDLGAYPGAVLSRHPGDRVHGEVLKLHRPERALRWLDDYEGCGENAPEPFGFERVIIDARLSGGRDLRVWIYHYRGSLGNARRLHSGRYHAAKSLERLRS